MTSRRKKPAKSRVLSRSLAFRLTAWYALSAFLLVFVATLLLYSTLENKMRRVSHHLVADRVHMLSVVRRDYGASYAELIEEVEREWRGGIKAEVYVRLLDARGNTISKTRGMMRRHLPVASFPPAVPLDRFKKYEPLLFETEGSVFDLFALRLDSDPPNAKQSILIHAAVDVTEQYALLALYRKRMAQLFAATLLISLSTGHLIARRGLRPVEHFGQTLRSIRSSTLAERLDVDGLPIELSTLAVTCNEMLDGLEASFDRLSRFSADIAHELRTPINNLRGEIDVTLARARPSEEYQAALASCLEEADRLSKLINTLLFLARSDGQAIQKTLEAFDLGSETKAIVEFYEVFASEEGVNLSAKAAPGLVALIDRTLFQSALGNLIENAIAATPRGGNVVIDADREAEVIRIDVSDNGRGVLAEDLSRVFDRLYRTDQARSGSLHGGAGLGLSIVRSIASMHGGSVTLQSEETLGTTATLRIPAAPAGTQAKPRALARSSDVPQMTNS